ncbi:MAG TPA: 1-(5-phosphoribosyl)-5-[(5-phosphoribosylamino)methylideneamino] imidazole-4-carboxamide isomerase [Candidatus Limnocylindrales bacterium]|nr:1-(5-phosphoribosyl)-5-[(5-phosphoribosylamino)methylideneamino] imidazole-4-carboxamide isomerase [Candidatus Limnocylindrales bacterium]
MGASGFDILPAIDLRGGRVVRLRQGDFARETTYSVDPVAVALEFADAGAGWIHIVDLDGAREGGRAQRDTTRRLLAAVGDRLRCQLAGGLRTADAAATALGEGAARIVIGTTAIRDPVLVGRLVADHGPDRIVVALDVRNNVSVGEGWRDGTVGIEPAEALRRLADLGVEIFAVTAIERDGLLEGPDLALLSTLVSLDRGRVIASGGISSIDDVRSVRALGCSGAIIGRALYEGSLNLGDALASLNEPGRDE